LTLLLWSGYSIGMFFICLSLRIFLPSLFASFLVQAITALSVIIPSSPGYIGTWEFMGTVALSIFNVEKTKGVSFGLLSHIVGVAPVVVLGMIYVIKEVGIINYIKESKTL
ncbi:MAG: flippase-like domain-containing protein, partial [Endomicrobia bacterium]|nr:flippase-like domain-containing protein [Endomicrobiia bacterium]